MSFFQFYQQGGVFMHVVTVLAIAATVILARRFKTVRHALRTPKDARLAEDDALTPILAIGAIMAGALGTAMGFTEVCAALRTVPPEQQLAAAARGGQIMMNPLVWSLMCALPIVLGHGALQRLEARLRRLLPDT